MYKVFYMYMVGAHLSVYARFFVVEPHKHTHFFPYIKDNKAKKLKLWIELKRAVEADDVCPVSSRMLWMKYAFSHRIWIDIKMFLNFNFSGRSLFFFIPFFSLLLLL